MYKHIKYNLLTVYRSS